jgi:hypothetical protein
MMEHFTRILYMNVRNVNIQLIQTTSIFLQNIQQETKKCKNKSFYNLYFSFRLHPMPSLLK